MPWHKSTKFETLGINPSCIETINLLQLFHPDTKGAKLFVSVAPRAPENIPPSQWE